jgi:glutathione S-transferase
MQYVELVAVFAVLQFLFFGAMTGKARGTYGVKAPAVTGHEGFERMYRVQMNSLETLIAFLPMLFLAGKYWAGWLVAAVGVVYIVGRHLYWRAYVTDPSKRSLGFMLSILPVFALLVLALVGAVMSLTGFKA